MSNRHPYAAPDGFGGGVHHTRNQKATIKAFDKFYSWFPAFLDIFPDEEAFLNFAFWLIVLTVVDAMVASTYIKINPIKFNLKQCFYNHLLSITFKSL